MRITVIVLMFITSPILSQEPAPTKRAIPNDTAQKAALSVVADVYKPDYEKAKTPTQRIELAKKLLGEGVATKDDTVSRYVLFRVSRDIAAQQGDLTTAFSAIGRIDQEFEVDQLQMKANAAATAVKALRLPKDHQECAALLAPLIDDAISVDRYDHAKSLAALTLGCAREGRDPDRIKQMATKSKEIEEIAAEFEKVKESKIALETKPTDPAANFAMGRFLCLFKGDWKRGVTMLALGENEEFKAAALLELEAQPDSLKLGDGWWKTAEGLEGTSKVRVQAHAVEWCRKALPGLSGLTKARIEQRVGQLEPSGRPKKEIKTVLASIKANGVANPKLLDCGPKAYRSALGESFRPEKSWTLAFEVLPTTFDVKWQQIIFWGDDRLGKDPLYVRLENDALTVAWADAVSEKGQAVRHKLDRADIGKWLNVLIRYEESSDSVKVYIDSVLVCADKCAVRAKPDRPMAVWVGGTNESSQRFAGKVKELWFGNLDVEE